MKPVLIQSIMKRRRRETVRPDPEPSDIQKERDRLFAFIMAVLAVIVLGSIIAVA
jgi:hypothetical protein